MFRAIISPILWNTRLCVYSLWYNAPTVLPAGDQDKVELEHFHLILVTIYIRCVLSVENK